MNATIPINHPGAPTPFMHRFLAACIAFLVVSLITAGAFWAQRERNEEVIHDQQVEIQAKASYIEVLETELEALQAETRAELRAQE